MKRFSHAVLPLILLVSALGLLLVGCGTSTGGSNNSNCSSTGFPYCMSWTSGTISANPITLGYNYTGNVVFTFSPAPPSGTPIELIFTYNNGADGDINAYGTSTGSTAVSFQVGGSSINQCDFVSPTQVNAYFGTPGQTVVNTNATEAITTFNWTTSTC